VEVQIGLLFDGLYHARVTMTNVAYGYPADQIEIALAVYVFQKNAFRLSDMQPQWVRRGGCQVLVKGLIGRHDPKLRQVLNREPRNWQLLVFAQMDLTFAPLGCSFFITMLSSISHLIFDLGGVIINLDTHRTVEAFARLAQREVAEVQPFMAEPFFLDYEKGLIGDAAFRDAVRDVLEIDVTDAEIDAAWNAMLLDIPPAKLNLLRALAADFRLFLLSNTNEIHLRCFQQQVQQLTGFPSLAPFFEKTYYSHYLRLRKPDVEIYEFVLQDAGIPAHATMFLDDNVHNLRGAQQIGIQTFHVHHPDTIFELFNTYSRSGHPAN
jgi:putative hydrolase of the HAD superfamily